MALYINVGIVIYGTTSIAVPNNPFYTLQLSFNNIYITSYECTTKN